MPKPALRTLGKLIFTFLFSIYLIAQGQSSKSEILWDNYGVPHIYGNTTEEMYYGFGWSQMHSHANLILQLYGQARGRAAEYWGKNISILISKYCCSIYRNKQKRIITGRRQNTKFIWMHL